METFHSLLCLSNSPLYKCTMSSFIHSSVDEYLGCFHILTAVNNASGSIGLHVYFQVNAFISFRYTSRNGIVGSYCNSINSKKKYFHEWIILLYNCRVETFLKYKNQGPEVIIEMMDKFVYVIYLYIFYKQSQVTINRYVRNICTNKCVRIVSALLHITIEHLENTAIKRDQVSTFQYITVKFLLKWFLLNYLKKGHSIVWQ